MKCYYYWFFEGFWLYGVIFVEFIEEVLFGDYIFRKFKFIYIEVCYSVISNIGMYCIFIFFFFDLFYLIFIWLVCIFMLGFWFLGMSLLMFVCENSV